MFQNEEGATSDRANDVEVLFVIILGFLLGKNLELLDFGTFTCI